MPPLALLTDGPALLTNTLGRSILLAVSTLLVATASSAQTPAPPHDAPTTLQSTSTLVLVPTLVQTAEADLVQALGPNDFILTDNGVRQAVTLEQQDEKRQPLAIVVLMQTGGSAARQFENYTNIGTMLEYITGGTRHQVALVTFDSQPEAIWDFTPDLADLKDGFQHPIPGDHGAAIFDAVNFGIDQLKQQPASSRRILILLSQTQDAGSKSKVDDVVRRLGESNITTYSVAFSPEERWLKDEFVKPRHGNKPYAMPNHEPICYTFNLSTPLGMAMKAMQTNAASEIASLSGGEYLQFGNRRALEQQFGALANHIPNRYMLTFRPTSIEPGFHALHVELAGHPGMQLSFRTSYWAGDAPH
jgi:VWFA-related protein